MKNLKLKVHASFSKKINGEIIGGMEASIYASSIQEIYEFKQSIIRIAYNTPEFIIDFN
jgi:hypothetical protein